MIKTNHKETLADKIADVLNTAPVTLDLEDDDLDNTHAKVVDADPYVEDDADEVFLSKLRRQNIDIEDDIRYKGVKANRKDIYGSSDDEQYESDEDSEDGVEEVEESEESENEDDGLEDKQNLSVEEEEASEDEYEDEMSDEGDSGDVTEKDDFKAMSKTDFSAEMKKGLCVRNQMNMWENLLETRIQLQKCLVTANKMPKRDIFIEIKQTSGNEFTDEVAKTKKSLMSALDKLLLLQKLVLKKYPETKNLDKKNKVVDDNNEEISSDTDGEKSEESMDDEKDDHSVKKRRKLNDFAKDISDTHDIYKDYRNSVIQKWNEKTKIGVMKNNTSTHSVLNHIDHILSDKPKLIKRTQLKRSEYTILGEDITEKNEGQMDDGRENRRLEEYNSEIFDDDDFYHQLLRELIEVKSADLTDPVQLSRQWIKLQNMRSKMKRKVDTKATKGRKIRYVVHTKLVNFMAPIDDFLWTEEAKNELFSSLFGKKQRASIV